MKNIYTKKLLAVIFVLAAFISKSQTTYYLKSGGNMTVLGDWGTTTSGGGTSPASFLGSNIWNVHNNSSVTLNAIFSVPNTATVNIGDGTNPIVFTQTGGGKVGSTTGANLIVPANATFVVDNGVVLVGSKTNINSASTFSFTANAVNGLHSDDFGNLVIDGALWLNGPTTVRGALTISNGNDLLMNSQIVTLFGNIAATTGMLIGDNFGAGLVFRGTGNVGTLNFSPGTEMLSYLTINFANAASFVNLNSNLLIDDLMSGALTMTQGGIKLNGFDLTTANTTVFNGGAGKFYGNASSELYLNSNTVSGSLNMDPTANSLNALNIFSSGSMSLGSMLSILDSIRVDGASISTGGNLTLKSTASLKGRVAEISGGGSLSGNITVETYIAGPVTDWAVLGASGVSGLNFNSWYGQIPMAIEGSATGVTSTAGQYFESVQGWNEGDAYGYDTTITVSTPISPGKGYWLFVGTGLASTADIVTTVSGSAVTGNMNIGLSNSLQNGDCLLANPFPSPISWDRIVANNPGVTTGDIWIYNADAGATTNYAGGISSHANGAKSTIPMGQGFYVRGIGAGPLVISESDKVSNNTGANPLIKTQSTTASIGNVLHLKVSDGSYSDETAIRFHSSATAAFDNGLDSKKWFESPTYAGYASMGPWTKRTSISTKSGIEDYAINSLPHPITNNAVIPVLVKAYATGQHTISVSGISNLAPGTCLTLKDKLLNITHNLAVSDYVFNLNDTTSTPRFELTVCANLAASINEINALESNEISVFPNPSNGDVNISTTIPGKYEIVNQIGQSVLVYEKTSDYPEVISIKNLQAGIYFLKTNSRNINKKIVIAN